MKFSVNLFGSLVIEQGEGEIIRLPTRKSEALLSYLLEDGGEVSREEVADLLWPLSGPDQARASLRQELSVLRKGLGPVHGDRVFSGSDRLAFDATDVETDLHKFRDHLSQPEPLAVLTIKALALYTGPFLANIRIRSQPFSDWVWTTRQNLEGQALTLGMEALSNLRTGGNAAHKKQIAQGLLKIDGCHEPAHRSLMQTYFDEGEPDLAKRQFALCKDALKSKLDVEPSEQTLLLMGEIETSRAPSVPPLRAPAITREHQRRVVTVLSLLAEIERPDPEEFAKDADKFATLAEKVIVANGGHVFESERGRVLAAFGYPQTQGRNADMALTAAFDLQDALEAGHGPLQSCQIGLSDGMVMVSEDLENGNSGRVFSGFPIRKAEQISHLSEPGMVCIDDSVSTEASPYFKRSKLENTPGLIRVHHPHNLRPFDQTEKLTSDLHPLVGREEILLNLLSSARHALDGSGNATTVLGRPGEGKSRLLQEVAHWALKQGFEVQILRGSVQAKQSALGPLIECLLRMAPDRTGGQNQTRQDLAKTLAPMGEQFAGVANYLSQLHRATKMSSDTELDDKKEVREGALNILSQLAERTTRQNPVLFLLEDAQWFDASTCEAITRLIDVLDNSFACLMMSSRTDELPRSLKHPLAQSIELPPLNQTSATQLFSGLLGDQSVPEQAQSAALEKSDGNPLMIEEFAKSLAHSPEPSEGDAGLVGTLFATPEIGESVLPNRLVPLLLSRIDSVPGAIQLLQQASVLGRRFRLAELVQLMSPIRVQKQVVDALEASEILFPVRRGASATYMFKHALINEAIYATIPNSYRLKLHAAAANALLSSSHGTDHTEVAQHFRAAGNHDAAARHFELSADKSMRAAAHAEAISEYCEALNMVGLLPLSTYRMQRELVLNRKAAAQHIAKRGIPTSDAAPFYEAAAVLSKELNDTEEGVNAAWGLWSIHLMVAELDRCLEIAEALHASLPEGASDPAKLIVSYMLGITHAYRGTSSEAVSFLETVKAKHSDDMINDLQSRFGMDIALTSDSFLAWVYALRGDRALADQTSERALARAKVNNTKLNHVFAHIFAATKALFLDDITEAATHASIGGQGAAEMGYKQWVAQVRFQIARIADLKGEESALREMEAAIEDYRSKKMILAIPYALVWIAEAHIRRGNPKAALKSLDELVEHSERTQQKYFDERGQAARAKAEKLLGE